MKLSVAKIGPGLLFGLLAGCGTAFETEVPRPEVFTTDDSGTARYLSVMYIGRLCLACQGEAISPKVAVILESEYPHVRAFGSALGDMRGAFSLIWPLTRNGHGR